MHISSQLNMGPTGSRTHLSLEHPGMARVACWVAERSPLIEECERMASAHLRLSVRAPFVVVTGLGTNVVQRCPCARQDDGSEVREGSYYRYRKP